MINEELGTEPSEPAYRQVGSSTERRSLKMVRRGYTEDAEKNGQAKRFGRGHGGSLKRSDEKNEKVNDQ